MRKWLNLIWIILLLAVGAVICALRWQVWFSMPEEPQWTGDTIAFSFPAFEQDTTPESLDILVLGDIHNRLHCADYDTLAARVPQADIVAQVGDWMDRGQNYYYQLLLREWTASPLSNLPVIACPGNHEYSKGLYKSLSPVWAEAFPHPANGPVGVPGVSYYTDLPNLRFIVIDTNPLIRLVYLTRTMTWLRKLMNEADDRYVVVMMHHPVLSAGKGRFNPLIYTAFRHVTGDADLVLAGHDHSYMRHTPFVLLNTAGKPKAQHFHFTPEVTDSVPVYGHIRIQPSELSFKVYRLEDGTLTDSLYVKHN